tara:strand:- start:52801 stop:53016 length:216 start_codon:yes stop_codon:yes gene_type:complete
MGIGIIIYASFPAFILSVIFASVKAVEAKGSLLKKLTYFIIWFIAFFVVITIVITISLMLYISMTYSNQYS